MRISILQYPPPSLETKQRPMTREYRFVHFHKRSSLCPIVICRLLCLFQICLDCAICQQLGFLYVLTENDGLNFYTNVEQFEEEFVKFSDIRCRRKLENHMKYCEPMLTTKEVLQMRECHNPHVFLQLMTPECHIQLNLNTSALKKQNLILFQKDIVQYSYRKGKVSRKSIVKKAGWVENVMCHMKKQNVFVRRLDHSCIEVIFDLVLQHFEQIAKDEKIVRSRTISSRYHEQDVWFCPSFHAFYKSELFDQLPFVLRSQLFSWFVDCSFEIIVKTDAFEEMFKSWPCSFTQKFCSTQLCLFCRKNNNNCLSI